MTQSTRKSNRLENFLARIRSSLQVKMTLWSGLTLVIASAILVAYSVVTLRQTTIDNAEKEALAISEAQALAVSKKLDLPLLSARTIAIALKGIKDPANPTPMTRDQVNKMLYELNVENPSFLGTDTLWEPNAFDELDSQYKNTPGHDATGRFIPYWVRRADGSVTVEALLDYETPGIGDWYILPRQQKKEMVFAPLVYPINGVDTVMATFIVPIMQGDTFYGIAGVDAPIGFVQEIVDSVDLYNGKADAVLLTASGTVIGFRSRPELVNRPATEVFADFKDLQARLEKDDAFVSLSPDGKDLRVFSPVEIGNTGTHWFFGLIIPFAEITASATNSTILQVAISIGLILIALIMLWFLNGQVVRPMLGLTKVANAVSQGNLNVTADIRTTDETGVLANAFNLMISQLRESFVTLEERVAERTQSLELASEVGRSVSQVRALDVMLKDATEIIRSKFDLYYVQVYLTDPSQTNLILQSGTGTVGADLVGRGHRLPLNTTSINGRAAVEKRSIVVADTVASPTFRPNKLLPETRSEMAVPLLIGEKVVGVLDLQSRATGALNQEILTAFEALAGQLAIAIQNATFLAETQQARAEVEAQARRLTRANWVDYLDAIHQPEEIGFVFEQNRIAPLTQTEPAKDNALIAPISVTGEALGNLVVEMEGQSPIARTDELLDAVARQVAQQIENLRLLESAERYRAEAEQASRRLTREGWKDYTDANVDQGLSYIYDLKEVRPLNLVGDQQVDESAFNLPLKVRDETIGKLAVQGLEPDNKEALELAKAVAERLGAHIESLRQQDQTQSALAQSEKLFVASRSIAQAADLQELLKATVETLNIPAISRAGLELFSYNAAGELDRTTLAATWHAAWWKNVGNAPEAVGRSLTANVLKLLSFFMGSTPLFINDIDHDERMDAAAMQVAKSQNYRALATLPLFVGTQQIGIVSLIAEEPHNFTQDEIRLFTALAPQIATVLENRRQFERAQQQAERESTLNIISQKIQSATSVEAVLQIAARELGHALGAPRTIAQLSLKDKK